MTSKAGLLVVLLFLGVASLKATTGLAGVPQTESTPSTTITSTPLKSRLIFVSDHDTICPNDGDPCYTVIDVMNADGSDRHHLLSGTFTPSSITPSPQGEYFVYISPENGPRNIFLVRMVDGQTTQITSDNDTTFDYLTWSPDGTRIAFSAEPVRTGNTTLRSGLIDIYAMNIDGTNRYRLTENSADNFNPVWSPDGQHIAFISDRNRYDEIFIMNTDGSNAHAIANDNFDTLLVGWSPNSNFLLYTRIPQKRGDVSMIYTFDVAKGIQRRLTSGTDDYDPAWSPDSQKIAFMSDRTGPDEIYVMNADGTHVNQLTIGQGDADSPLWSPDGKSIVFAVPNGNKFDIYTTYDLYIMMANGTSVKRLTYGGAFLYFWAN